VERASLTEKQSHAAHQSGTAALKIGDNMRINVLSKIVLLIQ